MHRRRVLATTAVLTAVVASLLGSNPASAHVVPSTTIALDVHETTITAALSLPSTDLAIATGIEIPAEGTIPVDTADHLSDYLADHFEVTSTSGSWTTTIAEIEQTDTEQWGTGLYPAVTAVLTLDPPKPADLRSFTLYYDAIIHRVVTADIFVILHSDWATGELESARSLGAITVDTVTGEVPPLRVNLDDGSLWQGFLGMLTLGISHIAKGTDHQLFLLSLLLPAPLVAIGRRWGGVASARKAVRRITAVTIAFTVGHSLTLALGVLAPSVPQQPIEALIAVSILVAAAHAMRPLFPGREPLIAGLFGLVHGMAFSTTLSALSLSGAQLGLSLLGFNLGIELMQLVVVLLVLPPVIVIAHTAAYRPLRIGAAGLTAVAAAGWLLARIGVPNAVAVAADMIGSASPWIALMLWLAGAIVVCARRLTAVRRSAGAGRSAGAD